MALLTAVATAGLGAGVVGGLHPATAAGSTVNLVVVKAGVDRTTLAEGDTLQVSFTAKNTGRKRSGKSRTRFYLTRDWAESKTARKASTSDPRSAPMDVLLVGEAPVPKLAPGGSAKVKKVELSVPVGTQPGSYTVLACADDTGKVAESKETDNCVPTDKPLGVTAPEGNDELLLQGFSDTYAWPDDEDEAWNVDYLKSWCKDAIQQRPMTLAGALASARKYLTSQVGAQAMQDLESSGLTDTAVDAQEVAAVAAIEGVPGLALAGFLRAHELEPKIGGHLINAAGVAVSIGRPNEALAFLDGAAGRHLRRPPMGISQQAIGMVVRAQALLLTGRTDAAEELFTAAKGAEPLLSEADAGLATVAACRDDDEKAVRFLRKSRQRTQEDVDDPTTEEVERPEPQIDYGHGRQTPMRDFPLAGTPAQLVAMHDVYSELADELDEEHARQQQEESQIEDQLYETDEQRTEAEIERRDSILGLVHEAGLEPDIDDVSDRAGRKMDEIARFHEEVFGNYAGAETSGVVPLLSEDAFDACESSADPNCYIKKMNSTCRPAMSLAHQEWRGLMTEAEALYREELALLSDRISTYAANLLDPDAHRLAALSIEWHEAALYGHLVQEARFWAFHVRSWEEECVNPLPVEILTTPAPSGAVTAGPCSERRKAISFVAAFGPAKVKVTCEKVTFEASAEILPLLHAFGEVSHHFGTGRTTIFAGSKAEGKVGVVEAGFKSGAYLTTNPDGSLYDLGWRVGPGVSAVGTTTEFEMLEDLQDISFLPEPPKGP